MPDIAVYVTNTRFSGINEAEFQVLDAASGDWNAVVGNLLEDGVYILPIEDDQDLTTCVPDVYECNLTNVGNFPSINPYVDPRDYEVLLIVLEEVEIYTDADVEEDAPPPDKDELSGYCDYGC